MDSVKDPEKGILYRHAFPYEQGSPDQKVHPYGKGTLTDTHNKNDICSKSRVDLKIIEVGTSN